jgi:CheY-like chemotaxis protein
METQSRDQLPISGIFGRRRIRPSVCVIDRKRHVRTFLRNILDDLDFITCECADHAELEEVLEGQRPDLVVLGLSAGGEEGVEVLNTLVAKEFLGKVLLLGPRASPMLAALQELGEQLKLDLLPALCTPFGSGGFAAQTPRRMSAVTQKRACASKPPRVSGLCVSNIPSIASPLGNGRGWRYPLNLARHPRIERQRTVTGKLTCLFHRRARCGNARKPPIQADLPPQVSSMIETKPNLHRSWYDYNWNWALISLLALVLLAGIVVLWT